MANEGVAGVASGCDTLPHAHVPGTHAAGVLGKSLVTQDVAGSETMEYRTNSKDYARNESHRERKY